jgi:hypothetical protein
MLHQIGGEPAGFFQYDLYSPSLTNSANFFRA